MLARSMTLLPPSDFVRDPFYQSKHTAANGAELSIRFLKTVSPLYLTAMLFFTTSCSTDCHPNDHI